MNPLTTIKNCTKCNELSTSRTNVVVGDESSPCPLVFLGEAPGAAEDRTGKAFCGKSGDTLEMLTFQCSLQRGEHYRILNTIKCRPPENRDPSEKELNNCRPYLDHQLALIKPRVIIALGRFAQAYILGEKPADIKVLENVGKQVDRKNGVAILSYHPAFICRMENPQIKVAFKKHILEAIAIIKRTRWCKH